MLIVPFDMQYCYCQEVRNLTYDVTMYLCFALWVVSSLWSRKFSSLLFPFVMWPFSLASMHLIVILLVGALPLLHDNWHGTRTCLDFYFERFNHFLAGQEKGESVLWSVLGFAQQWRQQTKNLDMGIFCCCCQFVFKSMSQVLQRSFVHFMNSFTLKLSYCPLKMSVPVKPGQVFSSRTS